jgi:aminoglycoside phosphotransferase (APT) family kinase protein
MLVVPLLKNESVGLQRTFDDEDDIGEAIKSQELAERLLELLPSLFSPHNPKPEQSVIYHDNLSFQNILVDEKGALTGIVD